MGQEFNNKIIKQVEEQRQLRVEFSESSPRFPKFKKELLIVEEKTILRLGSWVRIENPNDGLYYLIFVYNEYLVTSDVIAEGVLSMVDVFLDNAYLTMHCTRVEAYKETPGLEYAIKLDSVQTTEKARIINEYNKRYGKYESKTTGSNAKH